MAAKRATNAGIGGKPFTGEAKQSPRDYGRYNADESSKKDTVSRPNAWRDVGGEGGATKKKD